MKNSPLVCGVKDGQLTICVGVSTLAEAVENDNNWQIVNHENFVKDLAISLMETDKNGESLLTKTITEAARRPFNERKKKDEESWWIIKTKT